MLYLHGGDRKLMTWLLSLAASKSELHPEGSADRASGIQHRERSVKRLYCLKDELMSEMSFVDVIQHNASSFSGRERRIV